MDFELDQDQRAIVDAAEALLARHAGAARAIELARDGSYDHALDEALTVAGFSDVFAGDGTGPLEAVLLIEAVAHAGGTTAFAADSLVVPATVGRAGTGPTALAMAGRSVPVRFAPEARAVLVLDGDDARLVALEAGTVEVVSSSFGYPMGRVGVEVLAGGERLPAGAGETMRCWWRVALAAEAVGAMRAALDVTTEYLKNRRQFGRAIGSFQAVQHRLAECKVMIEGARWLVYEAAWRRAPAEESAVAAAHALTSAGRVFEETHQLSGAIGFTHEHDLHVWTMRLQALRLEMDGVGAHRRAVADARWA